MLKEDQKKKEHHQLDSIFRYAEMLKFGELHIKIHPETGLYAIIAIHDLRRGSAIGGCRFIHYDHMDEALIDAMRLAQLMSYKAAICDLPHGGAKSVIVKPTNLKDRQALFSVFGDFVNEQNGKYITALDSGTEPADMDVIATRTRYVTCTSSGGYSNGDPSPHTALGVYRGIEAAVAFKLGKSTLKNVHIAIQGMGHVGKHLCQLLLKNGARITACDTNPENLKNAEKEFGNEITLISPENIYSTDCDVFAPCALGNVLNYETINQLKASIVAGSANNQLGNHHFDSLLHEKGILYAPDFLINSGGLIYVSAIYDHGDKEKANKQIYNLYDTLYKLFERARIANSPTNEVAITIAEEKLKQ